MNEIIRVLGIDFSVVGTRLIEDLLEGRRSVNSLSKDEVDKIMDAWSTRKFVPIDKMNEAIDSRPEHIDGETSEQYDKRHIEKIIAIARGL